MRLKYGYSKEQGELNLLLKFVLIDTYDFWEIAVERFFVFYCFYMSKIGKIYSWISIFANTFPIFDE